MLQLAALLLLLLLLGIARGKEPRQLVHGSSADAVALCWARVVLGLGQQANLEHGVSVVARPLTRHHRLIGRPVPQHGEAAEEQSRDAESTKKGRLATAFRWRRWLSHNGRIRRLPE